MVISWNDGERKFQVRKRLRRCIPYPSENILDQTIDIFPKTVKSVVKVEENVNI